MSKTVFPASMPFDTVEIIDKSVYEDELVTSLEDVPSGPIAYCPFVSPRGYGEDNKLVYLNASTLSKFGVPNLAKYGLSLYLANQFVKGKGTVLGMRVVPEYVEATEDTIAHGRSYANVVVYATVKAASGTASGTIKYGVKSVKGNNPLENALATDFATENGIETPTGETLYPLFVIRAKSAGEFANQFYFTITEDATMNALAEENGYNKFFYKFVNSDAGNILDPDMTFSLTDFLYEGESMAAEDVFDEYSKNMVFEKVKFDDFAKAIGYTGEADILLTTEYTNSNDEKYTITKDAVASLIHLAGAVPLWTEGFTWEKDPFASTLILAYGNNGEAPAGVDTMENPVYTDLIYDQIRYPFQYIFAPSYDTDLVAAIHNLVTTRDITHAHYIVPYKSTYTSQRTNWNTNTTFKGCNDFREHLYANWATVRDPYTGKKERMPSVYFNAYGFPKHWVERKGKPYAGTINYQWTEHIEGTCVPVSSSDAQYIENHNVRFNTMIEDGRGSAVPYEQITAQSVTSALSEANNSYVLTDMIRIARLLAHNKRWTDLGDAEIKTYKDQLAGAIDNELANCYETLSIVAARESINGAGRNRIKCSLTVTFKAILKGVTYTFYIAAN